MNVLIACEFSGIVRDAFLARGHNAWSCDLLPTEKKGNHFQFDVHRLLSTTDPNYWDLMIAFPPCTYLTRSGLHLVKSDGQRRILQQEALDFVKYLLNAPVPKIALENPIGAISSKFRKPDQYIEPYWFGHKTTKKTCLWLKNLPPLIKTNVVPHELVRRGPLAHVMQKRTFEDRSRTFSGIAKAMAEQWG